MGKSPLNGRRVLVIVTNYGVEHDELVVPVAHLRSSGATVTIAAVKGKKKIQTLTGDKVPADTIKPDAKLGEVEAGSYDLLLIPGGTLNADALRLSTEALGLVRSFTTKGKPVAAICHGPWALVTADVVKGKTLTSYASLETDIRNAGAEWKDEPVVVDHEGGYALVTSRDPGDLDEFLGAIDALLV
ncbi:type 1 glutamine amidotransferase domain-containing protein [Cellulomonas edaphi]|uniref:Type 1 glutamine amidotransferase domain-containing protein n=1 Tax=Cellulomonas edaphi TaxID=3053468 RepID=A0ABT7S4U6_9CELL|nr:type 1 glutamine amidotransferase domain-containing protein [Cellulomons edaphi]MDM7830616.1 type 1 glutamine amidotransferase domain-containing protein [Cellulomons edaphi]